MSLITIVDAQSIIVNELDAQDVTHEKHDHVNSGWVKMGLTFTAKHDAHDVQRTSAADVAKGIVAAVMVRDKSVIYNLETNMHYDPDTDMMTFKSIFYCDK